MVRWPERIEREWPFLRRALGTGGRILDLGCGTGEHSRFLAAQGFDVIGVDASPSMIDKARETPVPENLQLVLGDIGELEALVEGPFDGAICLGNTLPHVQGRRALAAFASALRRRLRDGGAFVLQILNYEKIFERQQRFLPLNFREGAEPGEEAVFLRLMTLHEDGSLIFTPSTLRLRPDADPPLEVVSSRSVPLHGWRRKEIEEALETAGFDHLDLFGTVGDTPYLPLESPDLVVVAR